MYKNKFVPYLFITPMLIFMIVFLFYPFTINIFNSFYKFQSRLDINPVFTGISNYLELFNSYRFQAAIKNTLFLIVLVIIFQCGIALILAFLVSSIKRLSTLFKITFFMPVVITATALGLMFTLFYDYQYGMFNQILLNIGEKRIFWLDPSDFNRMFAFVIAPVIWQYIGFYFVIFLTGIASIPDEIIEASTIDGCNSSQKTLKIKIPMLHNVIRTVIVLAITGTLKVFDLPHIIQPNGFPAGKSFLFGTYMYDVAFNSEQVGVAAAFAVFMVFAGILLSGISNTLIRENKDL